MADQDNNPTNPQGPSTPPPASPPPAGPPAGSTPPPQAPPQAPPPQQYGQPGQYGQYGMSRPQGKGFWSRFFDFSFKEFITPSIIKILFIIIMVVIALSIIGAIIVGFMGGVSSGIFALVGSIIYGFLLLLFTRVWLELVIIFFRIHDDTSEIARNTRR